MFLIGLALALQVLRGPAYSVPIAGFLLVLPQHWMMTHSRGGTPALASHFVAVMAFCRVPSGTYMWYAHSEITCEPWIGDFNHAGHAILAMNFECCAVLGKGASGKVFLLSLIHI